MSAEIAHLFARLPDLGATAHDLSYTPDVDAFVARIGAAGNRFGEWRKVASNKGWLRVERMRRAG